MDMRGQKEDINSNNNTNTPFVSERVVVSFGLLAGSPQEECILVLPPRCCSPPPLEPVEEASVQDVDDHPIVLEWLVVEQLVAFEP